MIQIVNITDARNNLGNLVKEVARKDKTVVIIRDSFPEAALIPYKKAVYLEEENERRQKLQFTKVFSAIRKAGRTWMKKKNIDWKKMTEEEFYELIDKI